MAKPILAKRRFHSWMIYSAGGAGKTSLLATAPRPIILDSNQGVLSIAEKPGLTHVRSEDIFSMEDMERAYERCKDEDSKWRKLYRTLGVDHFDDMQAIVMEELGDKRHLRDDRKDEDEAEQRDYGIMRNKLKRWIRRLKSVPMHKVLICGEMPDKESGRFTPQMIGALAREAPYLMDHVAYLRIGKKGRRYLHLDPTDRFYAKTRAWWLTPEQRVIRVQRDDHTTLTKLFALVAAGPKGVRSRGEEE